MRIISLCPSLTELIFDLGRGADLVGRTKFCIHPAGLVDAVESVGGTKNPKIDRIVALAPDLVLMNEEENRREDAAVLRAAGVVVHASFPRDAAATAAMVRSIGDAVGARPSAERIASDIERRSRRVRDEAMARAARGVARVRFAYLIWRRPYMVVSGDTFVSALLEQAGGENVFAAHADRYPTVTGEELAATDPALVLLSTEPFPFGAAHFDELVAATGLPRARVRIVDGELLSWHGSRTPRGIDYAGDIIGAAAVPATAD